MPSVSFHNWSTVRASALDAVERGHTAIRGTGSGRREAVRQLNHAYTVLLAAEFQGFCRELHSEAVDSLVSHLPPGLRTIIENEFTWNRQLDRGNANPATLGADFGRLGLNFWGAVDATAVNGPRLRNRLDVLNSWRNAIAHNDYDPARLGGTIRLTVSLVRRWRRNCHRLARLFDRVVADYLTRRTGTRPW